MTHRPPHPASYVPRPRSPTTSPRLPYHAPGRLPQADDLYSALPLAAPHPRPLHVQGRHARRYTLLHPVTPLHLQGRHARRPSPQPYLEPTQPYLEPTSRRCAVRVWSCPRNPTLPQILVAIARHATTTCRPPTRPSPLPPRRPPRSQARCCAKTLSSSLSRRSETSDESNLPCTEACPPNMAAPICHPPTLFWQGRISSPDERLLLTASPRPLSDFAPGAPGLPPLQQLRIRTMVRGTPQVRIGRSGRLGQRGSPDYRYTPLHTVRLTRLPRTTLRVSFT